MIILHDENYYRSRKPQPDLGPYKNFLRFIWNSERKTFFDRTAKEWGDVVIYYIFFFGILGFIFVLQMYLSLQYVADLKEPFFKYKGLLNVRGLFEELRVLPWFTDNPGIGYKPNIPLPLTSPIIWINEKNKHTRSKRYVEALTEFFQGYTTNTTNQEFKCNENKVRLRRNLKSCYFDVRNLGICGESPYGYGTMPIQPCVLIKFNKRLGWIPQYYNQSSVLPEGMPDFLKDVVKKSDKFHIWLSCTGVDNVDKEHIGNIEYIPNPGFPIEYFPFIGQKDYLSPIVAIKFKNLTRNFPFNIINHISWANRLLTVRCAAWSSNIEQHATYYLDFQIIIEK